MCKFPTSCQTRITPACAGSTHSLIVSTHNSQDHPRLRGEYAPLSTCVASNGGSPPLARGVRVEHMRDLRQLRITPACAGSTAKECTDFCEEEDHPRLRGEYYYHSHTESLLEGSPPLARGVRYVSTSYSGRDGITPAYAGSTKRSS